METQMDKEMEATIEAFRVHRDDPNRGESNGKDHGKRNGSYYV